MTFRKTTANFFRTIAELVDPDEEENPSQPYNRVNYPARQGITAKQGQVQSENWEQIHEAILQEQFVTGGQFVCEMLATKGEDRTKFMQAFCDRKGIKYS